MLTETLQIFDQSLRYSLIAFLFFFALFSLYSLARTSTLRRARADFFEKRMIQSGGPEDRLKDLPPPYQPPAGRLRPLFHSLILAAVLSIACFFVSALAPLPFIHNLASESDWKDLPLRLTHVNYERFVEGFSLRGQVWNQTEEPIEGLSVRVTVYDQNRRVLEEVETSLEPETIEAGDSSSFELRYERNSPFIYGYRIFFLDSDGEVVPHTEGFDVR